MLVYISKILLHCFKPYCCYNIHICCYICIYMYTHIGINYSYKYFVLHIHAYIKMYFKLKWLKIPRTKLCVCANAISTVAWSWSCICLRNSIACLCETPWKLEVYPICIVSSWIQLAGLVETQWEGWLCVWHVLHVFSRR